VTALGKQYNYNNPTEYEKEKSSKKKSMVAKIIMLVAGVGALVLLIAGLLSDKPFNSSKVIYSAEVTSRDKYVGYGEGYIKYNTDGAEAIKDGKALWNVSFNMKNPIVDVCGDYCAFADKGMQTVCVTDGKGGNFPINIPDKIVAVSVASQGVTAVWADSLTKDHIYVYDINGVLLIDIETSIATNGFPISIDISDDGEKLVTSYMMTGSELVSWVTFYNFGSVGQNYAGKVVGSYSFENKIIPEVRFVSNDRVCAFGEDCCILYKMKQKPVEIAVQETTRLTAVCTDENSICLAESETDGEYTISVYDVDGKSKKSIVTGVSLTGMTVSGNELMVYNNSTLQIYYLDGDEKYRTKLDGGIRNVYPAGKDKYCVIGGSEVRVLELGTEEEEK